MINFYEFKVTNDEFVLVGDDFEYRLSEASPWLVFRNRVCLTWQLGTTKLQRLTKAKKRLRQTGEQFEIIHLDLMSSQYEELVKIIRKRNKPKRKPHKQQ